MFVWMEDYWKTTQQITSKPDGGYSQGRTSIYIYLNFRFFLILIYLGEESVCNLVQIQTKILFWWI